MGWFGEKTYAFLTQGPSTPQAPTQAVQGVDVGQLPPIMDAPCAHTQTGGRAAAELLCSSLMENRAQAYRAGLSSPLTGERACSRLSPYLALGTLSARQTHLMSEGVQTDTVSLREGQRAFQSRLAWRDHFTQKLEDAPDMQRRALNPLACQRPDHRRSF